ncbi:MAG: hypothetical protein ACD_75C02339G0006, partial [uncultured bacterium]
MNGNVTFLFFVFYFLFFSVRYLTVKIKKKGVG